MEARGSHCQPQNPRHPGSSPIPAPTTRARHVFGTRGRVAPLGSRFCFRHAEPGAGPRHHSTPMPSASGRETVNEQPTRIWARGDSGNGTRVGLLIRAGLQNRARNRQRRAVHGGLGLHSMGAEASVQEGS